MFTYLLSVGGFTRHRSKINDFGPHVLLCQKKQYTPPKTSENLITCQWKITILNVGNTS